MNEPEEFVLRSLHHGRELEEFMVWCDKMKSRGYDWIRLRLQSTHGSLSLALDWYDHIRNSHLYFIEDQVKITTVLEGNSDLSGFLVWLASNRRKVTKNSSVSLRHMLTSESHAFDKLRSLIASNVIFTNKQEQIYKSSDRYQRHIATRFLATNSLLTAKELSNYFHALVEV